MRVEHFTKYFILNRTHFIDTHTVVVTKAIQTIDTA